MNGSEWRHRVIINKTQVLVMTGIVNICMCILPAVGALGQSSQKVVQPTISAIQREAVIFVQMQSLLRPKPGYIIGRALGGGKPILALEITVNGFPTGSPIEYVGQFEPPVDPRTGYYQLKIDDGAYRVSARFNKRARNGFPPTVECLLMLEDIVSADGTPHAQQPYRESRRGIVMDFVWNPNPRDVEKCGLVAGF